MSDKPGGPVRRPSIGARLPLKALTTFITKWTTMARVLEKSQINTFTRKSSGGGRGSAAGSSSGKVFNCVIVDKEGTSMMVKFWNEMADKFYDVIEVGKVYSFSKGQIQVANKRFSRNIDHDYEIVFQRDGEVNPVADSEEFQDAIPQSRQVAYQSLRSINMSTKTLPFSTDVLGVVHSWQSAREVNTTQGPRLVRRITVVDGTRFQLDVSLWGELAEADEGLLDQHPIVSLQNLSIREFRGRAASTIGGTTVIWNVESDEAKELAKWYNENGLTANFTPLSQNDAPGSANPDRAPPIEATLRQVEAALDNPSDSASQVFKVVAYITRVLYRNPRQDNRITILYDACSKCNRKVSEGGYCQNCASPATVVPRLSLTILLGDNSAQDVAVRVFHSQAQTLLGLPLQKIQDGIEKLNADPDGPVDPDLLEAMEFTPLWKRFSFLLRIQRNLYQGEARSNITIIAVNPASHRAVAASAMQKILQAVPNAFELLAATKRSLNDDSPIMAVKENSDPNLAEPTATIVSSEGVQNEPDAKKQKISSGEADHHQDTVPQERPDPPVECSTAIDVVAEEVTMAEPGGTDNAAASEENVDQENVHEEIQTAIDVHKDYESCAPKEVVIAPERSEQVDG